MSVHLCRCYDVKFGGCNATSGRLKTDLPTSLLACRLNLRPNNRNPSDNNRKLGANNRKLGGNNRNLGRNDTTWASIIESRIDARWDIACEDAEHT